MVAVDALVRVEEGAFANLVMPAALSRSHLEERDRAFATDLVYGTTRMRRACDWLIERSLDRPLDRLDPPVRAALRLGAYQLLVLRTPPHAAVSATVDCAPRRASGLVNAVLRRVATAVDRGVSWPSDAVRLSYPDWMVERLAGDLGPAPAIAALEQMNEPASVHVRDDGYVQDEASEQVAAYVAAQPAVGRGLTFDMAAAPGGKATAIAGRLPGERVVAADVLASRVGLVRENVARLRLANVAVVQADGRHPPLRPASLDRVLIDAPCSGLGVLRRRPDARWRITPESVTELAALQRDLLDAAVPLLAPGGTLVYSVCTLTDAESVDVDRWLAETHPDLEAVAPPGAPWAPAGRGARLLPQTIGSDGMFLLALKRGTGAGAG